MDEKKELIFLDDISISTSTVVINVYMSQQCRRRKTVRRERVTDTSRR